MNTQKQVERLERKNGAGCCGGPAPIGVEACCVKDAEAKAGGKDGCGCDNAPARAAITSSCCGADSRKFA